MRIILQLLALGGLIMLTACASGARERTTGAAGVGTPNGPVVAAAP